MPTKSLSIFTAFVLVSAVLCLVFCTADALAVTYLKMVVIERQPRDLPGQPGENNPLAAAFIQVAGFYIYDGKGAEIATKDIKIFAPEDLQSAGDGYTGFNEGYSYANALDRNNDTFAIIYNNGNPDPRVNISEKDPLPVVFELHSNPLSISKFEVQPRTPCCEPGLGPKRFYFEVGPTKDGPWQKVGEKEYDVGDGVDKKTVEFVPSINLVTAVKPLGKFAVTWGSLKAAR